MTESSTTDGGDSPDAATDGGSARDSTSGTETAAGSSGTDTPPDPTASGSEKQSNGSPMTAVAAATGIGFLGPVIAVVLAFVVFAIDAVVGLSVAASLALSLFFGQYVAFAGLAVVYLLWRGLDRSEIVSYLGVRKPTLTELGIVVIGWVVIIGSLASISVVIQLIGVDTASNQSAELAMQNPAIIPLLIAASFLVIGPCEEILYRGVVQGRLRESLPAVPSIVIAAAIFAFIHVMALTGGITGRLTTVSILFVPSLVFGAVYEYTENIVVPSLLHGLHNAVIFTLLYVTLAYGEELDELAEAGAVLLAL